MDKPWRADLWAPTVAQAQKELRRERGRVFHTKRRRFFVVLLALALIAGWVASTQLFYLVRVTGVSMEPTMPVGGLVLCARRDSALLTLLFGSRLPQSTYAEQTQEGESPGESGAVLEEAAAGEEGFSARLLDQWVALQGRIRTGIWERPQEGLFSENVAIGETVLFERDGRWMIRRVAALAGDEVVYSQGDLLVNGVRQSHEADAGDRESPLTVANRSVYVLGDRRDLAEDSRSRRFGDVPVSAVLGKGAAVVWPLWRVRLLNG